MDTFQNAVLGLLSVGVLVIVVMFVVLAREVGIILVRLGPAKTKPMPDALPIGKTMSGVVFNDTHGGTTSIGTSNSVLVVALAPGCGACQKLMPGLRAFLAAPRGALEAIALLCSSDVVPDAADDRYVRNLRDIGMRVVISPELCADFGIFGSPYAVLIESGVVRSKGIVNSLQQLEALFATHTYSVDRDASVAEDSAGRNGVEATT